MLEAFGWVIVRTARDVYPKDEEPLEIPDNLDVLDEEFRAMDRRIWAELRSWLATNADFWFKWQFFEELNNADGILQFCTSRNHRGGSSVWPLMSWIAKNGTGSYGLVYVQDDEDGPGSRHEGRGQRDLTNVFRVWRILGGKVEEFDDPFLSPIVPLINPSFYA
jgi:hypothetical protein